jgi:prepilin-type N-terminal cleavage/methylation domain-containing protein
LSKSLNSAGFTITELIITITLMGIISVTFLGLMTDYFANITRNNASIDMTVDSQNLLRSTVDELRYGIGVRQTNAITDPSPPGTWNTSNENFVIIIATPAKNSSGDFIIDSSTGIPYANEQVYYKQDNDLYRRTLANPNASGNSVKTTCPPPGTGSCPADSKLIENLDNMVFTLYDQDNSPTNDPTLAQSVKIDLSMVKDTFGDPLTLDNSIRVTLRNNFQ